jgi:hypothetical protein
MYTAANWYWAVAGSPAQVWSSARLQFVSTTDATYQAWLAAGGITTAMDSVTNLGVVMQQQVVPLLQSAGVELQSAGTPAISGLYAVDPISIGQATAVAADIANNDGLPGGGSTFTYIDALGQHGPMSQVNFLNAYKALKNFVYECGLTLAANLAGGQAALPSQPVAIP